MAAGARSIQWRILVWILPLQVLIFAGFHVWLDRYLRATAESEDLARARRAQRAVLEAVETKLSAEPAHQGWDRLSDRIPCPERCDVQVFGISGRLLYSSTPASWSPGVGLRDAPCNLCHENGARRPAEQEAVLRVAPQGTDRLIAAPLENRERCRGCHVDGGERLGMVLVRSGVRSVGTEVRTAQIASATVGALVLLLTALTIRLQLRRHVRGPLDGLVGAAAAIEAGGPSEPISPPPPRELTGVAHALARSAARVARLEREVRENARLASVGQTVAGLSHTLKNVLNGLRAGRFVVDRAIRLGDEQKLRKGLRVTRSSVRMVERLIFDMLHYAKDREPQRVPVDPNEIIREVIDELRQMAGGWGIELRANLEPGIGVIALDRMAIYRALVDLVTNAIEACAEIDTGNLVVLGSRSSPGEVILTVYDNGVGMTQEVLARLYTRFVSTKASGGTGLGMVVVKKIVDEHGGSIEVESVPGKGTTFRIHLPRTTESESA